MQSDLYFKRLVVTTLGLFFILFIGGLWSLQSLEPAHSDSVTFIVVPGDGLKEIANGLYTKGLIKSSFAFKLYSLAIGSAMEFKAGAYHLTPSLSAIEIANRLRKGPEPVTVVVKEGATLVDIDRILSEATVLRTGELIEYNRNQKESLEGLLFPDTYTFASGSSVETVVKTMRNNFDVVLGPFISGKDRDEWYADLILASILEKEALYPRDRLIVAGILRERMRLGMALQVDAANVYIKCEGAYMTCSKDMRELTKSDLRVQNPYNTYIHLGLPPTPISNPGKESFIAAQNPERSSYLYYISNPKNGRLVFAATLEGHNKNRQKYHVD